MMTSSELDGELPKWNPTIASALKSLVPGYPRLAGEMEMIPELLIFRRFGALNARNLLYMQHELIALEERLKQIEYTDSTCTNGSKSLYAKDFSQLKDSQHREDAEQWKLVLEMREKLKEYNEALLQQHVIQNLDGPGKYDSRDIRHFIFAPEGMNSPFTGTDQNTWGTIENPELAAADLIALRPRLKEDKFSSFVATYAVYPYSWFAKSDKNGGILYRDKTILRFTYWMNGIVASLIPIACIWVLQGINNLKARIATIAAFNLLVTVCMQGLTGAKRPEVFAVIAGFTAVQVVFVGQTLEGVKEVRPAADAVFNTTCS